MRGSGAYVVLQFDELEGETGISVWYVARNEICGDMRSDERKDERCWLCVLDSGWRLSIMRKYSRRVLVNIGHLVT